MSQEAWRAVIGFEGCYEVSNLGRVLSVERMARSSRGSSLRRVRPRILTPAPTNKYGHLVVNLSLDGVANMRTVHRLVLEAFVGPRPEGMEARHFPDRNPANNRLENLSWATHATNMADQEAHGTKNFGVCAGEDHPVSKLTYAKAEAIRIAYEQGGVTQKDLAERFGVSGALISSVVNRKSWNTKAV
jgi:antitoxin component HigA of HigAB toxin-antitoxin module